MLIRPGVFLKPISSDNGGGASGPTPDYIDGISTFTTPRGISTVRRLWSSYTGPLIRVRRSSDNTEQDIDVTASGRLDTAALLAFVGAGNAEVVTFYNQLADNSNANYNFTVTGTNYPTIVTAGVLETLNGNPAAKFNGSQRITNQVGFVSFTSNTNTGLGLFGAIRPTAETANGDWFGQIASGTTASVMYRADDDNLQFVTYNGSYAVANKTVSTTPYSVVATGRWTGTEIISYADGVPGTPTAAASITFGGGLNSACLGAGDFGTYTGYIAEMVLITTNPTNADMNIIGEAMAEITGTTWTTVV